MGILFVESIRRLYKDGKIIQIGSLSGITDEIKDISLYIEKNFSKKLTLNEIANLFNISVSKLVNIFLYFVYHVNISVSSLNLHS